MTLYIQKGALESKNDSIDWTPKGFSPDTIASATLTFAPNGLSVTNVSGSGTTSNFTVSGGVPASTYTGTATITTVGGQEFEETIYCFVEP